MHAIRTNRQTNYNENIKTLKITADKNVKYSCDQASVTWNVLRCHKKVSVPFFVVFRTSSKLKLIVKNVRKLIQLFFFRSSHSWYCMSNVYNPENISNEAWCWIYNRKKLNFSELLFFTIISWKIDDTVIAVEIFFVEVHQLKPTFSFDFLLPKIHRKERSEKTENNICV